MTAISEKIAREHMSSPSPIVPQRLVLCSCDDYETSRDVVAHTRHIVEATQAFIAADIEAMRIGIDNSAHPADRAARIARGTDR